MEPEFYYDTDYICAGCAETNLNVDVHDALADHGLNLFSPAEGVLCVYCGEKHSDLPCTYTCDLVGESVGCLAEYKDVKEIQKNKGGDVGKKHKFGSSVVSGGTGGSFSNMKGSSTNSQSSMWSGSSYLSSHKKCPKHTGTKVVWEDKLIKLAGAQGSEVVVDSDLALVIDLAGMYKPVKGQEAVKFKPAFPQVDVSKSGLFQGPEWSAKMAALSSHVSSPAVLRIQNPDMGIPPVGFTFWQELYNLLPEGRTVCCCVGGHGRTGTALAALILAGDHSRSAKSAIQVVRKHHCDNAIESDLQETYLELLANERDSLCDSKAKG